MMSGVVRSREAERLAKHRAEFALAVAEGLSLREARERIAVERRRQVRDQIRARQQAAIVRSRSGERPQPWMMAE